MNDFSNDVDLARQGNTEAFARLYSTVYEDLYHIAQKLDHVYPRC